MQVGASAPAHMEAGQMQVDDEMCGGQAPVAVDDEQVGGPEELIGDWKTPFGIYRIVKSDLGELHFHEDRLHGVLQSRDGWYHAEVRNTAAGNEVFGFLRLKQGHDGICSSFKKDATQSWDELGHINATALPYLRGEMPIAFQARWDQSTCCICMEQLAAPGSGSEGGSDGGSDCGDGADGCAVLRCHHAFHKGCIHEWFRRNASCPMRCGCGDAVAPPSVVGAQVVGAEGGA